MSLERDPVRAHVVRRLLRLGMSVSAATSAVDEDRVTLALLDHLVGGARTYTREQAALRSGLDLEVVEAIDRIAGAGEDARYSEAGIQHLALIARLLQFLPVELVLEQVRADIPTLRALALRTLDAAEEMLALGEAVQVQDIEEQVETAVQLAEAVRPLLSLSTDLVGQSFRRVLLELMNSDLVAHALRTTQDTFEVAVGFVDVVGYTSLSARVDPTGLLDVLSTFEAECLHATEERPEVSLVKFLGDAAMLVSVEPIPLADALYDLVSRHEQHDHDEDMPVSAGMAYGPALLRGGDYFGTPVNEAARLTDLARRHSVLVSSELHEPLAETFDLRRLRPVKLHGLGRQRPYAIRGRRSAPAGDEEE